MACDYCGQKYASAPRSCRACSSKADARTVSRCCEMLRGTRCHHAALHEPGHAVNDAVEQVRQRKPLFGTRKPTAGTGPRYTEFARAGRRCARRARARSASAGRSRRGDLEQPARVGGRARTRRTRSARCTCRCTRRSSTRSGSTSCTTRGAKVCLVRERRRSQAASARCSTQLPELEHVVDFAGRVVHATLLEQRRKQPVAPAKPADSDARDVHLHLGHHRQPQGRASSRTTTSRATSARARCRADRRAKNARSRSCPGRTCSAAASSCNALIAHRRLDRDLRQHRQACSTTCPR